MNLSITQKRVWGVLLVLQIFILWICISLNPIYAIGIVVGIVCLIYLLCGSNQLPKAILLTIIVSSVMLLTSRKFLFRIEELPFIFVIVFFLFNRSLGKKSNSNIGTTGKWLTVFLLVVVLSAVIGIQRGRGFRLVGGEFIIYLYYLLFFFVIESNLSEKWIKYIIFGVIGVACVITFEYILIYYVIKIAQRAATDQQHMLNIGIPLVFSWILYEKKAWIKLLLSLLLIPMGFAVLITLTRMLWVSVPLSILAILLLYLWREKVSAKYFLYAGVGVAIVIIFLIFPVKNLITRQVTLQHIVKNRAESFTRLKTDLSWLGRAELASYVLPRVKKHPIIGTGLGDEVFYKIVPLIYPGVSLNKYVFKPAIIIKWVDSTYLQLLWKTGSVGLFLFIGLYVVFLKRCLFVFNNSINNFEKWTSLGIFVGFVSLSTIGFLSAILVGYRFNFTWAALMGIIELQAQRIETRNKSKLR